MRSARERKVGCLPIRPADASVPLSHRVIEEEEGVLCYLVRSCWIGERDILKLDVTM